ncbi:MAG: TatD family deoxyribonuclease [Clostridiales bacterium]|nr:TatD family deoxyribonuclease [Clostridiales bacterium]
MRLYDTHCHIASDVFDEDINEVIDRFRAAGVERALVVADPCEEVPNHEKVFALIRAHDFLFGAIGVHPHNASRWSDDIEALVKAYVARSDCRLWGEIGLDYHYDLSPRDVQKDVFDRQLDLAYDAGIPVQLHIREAHGDTMDMLRARARAGRMPKGIMHCYTGSWEAAKVYLDLGLYISLSGAVTFKNAPKLAEVAVNVPADRLLIETDCPYMAPVPLRGRRNEPAFIVHTFEKICALREETPEALSEQLWQNSVRIIGD